MDGMDSIAYDDILLMIPKVPPLKYGWILRRDVVHFINPDTTLLNCEVLYIYIPSPFAKTCIDRMPSLKEIRVSQAGSTGIVNDPRTKVDVFSTRVNMSSVPLGFVDTDILDVTIDCNTVPMDENMMHMVFKDVTAKRLFVTNDEISMYKDALVNKIARIIGRIMNVSCIEIVTFTDNRYVRRIQTIP